MSKTEKQILGEWGEDKVVEFLERNNYEVIDRNVSIKKGEIDIIGWHEKYHWGRTLCFIEVKTRSYGVGSAERATRGQKLSKFIKTARLYCANNSVDIDRTPIQFEQVSVYVDKRAGKIRFRKYEIPVD